MAVLRRGLPHAHTTDLAANYEITRLITVKCLEQWSCLSIAGQEDVVGNQLNFTHLVTLLDFVRAERSTTRSSAVRVGREGGSRSHNVIIMPPKGLL